MRAGGVLGSAIVLLLAGYAVGQQPGTTGSSPSTGTGPPTPPTVKIPDYFGPSGNQPFSEKALFPNAASPNGGSSVPVLQPIPGDPPPTLIPDGTLPPPPPPKRWFGGFEFGLNGSQGNSNIFSGRLGGNVDRKTDDNLFHVDLLYTLNRQDGTTNQDQALLNVRDEILFKGTPWSIFSATQVEYDQFRAYDFRVGTYLGLAYAWVKTDRTLFKTRLGAGAVREIDSKPVGPLDRWVPEAVIGMDFNHRFSDRQGFVSSLDVYPNLSTLGQYRVRARAGYEIVIDPAHGLVLRLGLQDRYDSSPGPAKRNDLNYFTTLLFKF
jgi:hypothetical protein